METTRRDSADGRSRGLGRAELGALAVLAVLVVVAFREVVGPERGLAFRDHLTVFRPWFWNLVEALRHGELPAMTRASPAGVPLESLFIPAYTPSTLLLFLGPFEHTYDLFVVSLYVILAWGAWLLARELGATRAGALLAGGSAALVGPILSFENLLGATVGMAWAPWMYTALARVLRRPSGANVAALAVTTGFHLQGIMPELVVADVAALALIVLVVQRDEARSRRTLLVVAALVGAALVAVGIASVRLFPVFEGLRGSERLSGFTYALASLRALGLPSLVELFVPAFWTPPEVPFLSSPDGVAAFTHSRDPDPAYLTSLYLGTALVPGLAGLVTVADRRVRVLVVALALWFFVLALGPLTPVHEAWFALPGMSSIRFPVKWLALTAALVAAGLPGGLAIVRTHPKVVALFVALQLSIVAGALASVDLPELGEYVRRTSEHVTPAFTGVTAEDLGRVFVDAATPRLWYAAAVLTVALALVVAATLRPRLAGPLSLAYAALVLVDLAGAGAFTIEGADVRLAPPGEVLGAIESDAHRTYVVLPSKRAVELTADPALTFYEQRTASDLMRGHARFQRVRPYEDMNRDATSSSASALRFRLVQGLRGNEARRALARAGVAWVLSHRVDDTPNAWSFDVPGEPPHWVLPIAGVRPYVRGYTRWRTARVEDWDRGALVRGYLADESFEIAVVREGVHTSTSAPAGCTSNVELSVAPTDTHIAVTSDSACPTIVVVLETHVPGWRVTIDGTERPVLDAELGFLGAEVPAGRHAVVFEYRARTTRWVPVSVGALVVALGLAIIGRRRRPVPEYRSPPPPPSSSP